MVPAVVDGDRDERHEDAANVRLDVKQVPGLKTGTVWGSLKGTTDENI